MNDRERKKPVKPGTIVAILIALIAAEPEFIGPILGFVLILAIAAAPFVILYFVLKNKGHSPKPSRSNQKDSFDECPKPFCFHKDKGEHHVRRGKEIDPWDRPDIDISRYQRRS